MANPSIFCEVKFCGIFCYVHYSYTFTIYDPVSLNACLLNLSNIATGISWCVFKICFLLPDLSLPSATAAGSNVALGVLITMLLHQNPLVTS